MNNAARYGENGGQIRLSARNEGDGVVIPVLDRGVGIPQEKLPQMSEPFARGGRSLARIEAAREHRPDFALLDIGLPGMDGHEVAARLRREEGCKDAVIIAIPSCGRDEDRRRSKEAGFDHHLIKPLDLDALLALHSDGGRGRSRAASWSTHRRTGWKLPAAVAVRADPGGQEAGGRGRIGEGCGPRGAVDW